MPRCHFWHFHKSLRAGPKVSVNIETVLLYASWEARKTIKPYLQLKQHQLTDASVSICCLSAKTELVVVQMCWEYPTRTDVSAPPEFGNYLLLSWTTRIYISTTQGLQRPKFCWDIQVGIMKKLFISTSHVTPVISLPECWAHCPWILAALTDAFFSCWACDIASSQESGCVTDTCEIKFWGEARLRTMTWIPGFMSSQISAQIGESLSCLLQAICLLCLPSGKEIYN